MLRLLLLALLLGCAGCSRPVSPGHVRLKLTREQCVSLGLFDAEGRLVAQPFTGATLAAGTHEIDCRMAPPGEWSWRAVGFEPVWPGGPPIPPALTGEQRRDPTRRTRPQPLALVGGGLLDGRGIGGGEAGPPCAIAADENLVYLGWRAARTGHEIVACDPQGRVRWGHHHGPGSTGVRALAADGGIVYVLAGVEGSTIYRLDAATGAPLPWKGPLGKEITIPSLWGAQPQGKPTRADYLAADHNRVYVTFTEQHFVAVLDGQTGSYLTTLVGPQPGAMAFSTTPYQDPQTKEERPIDFGVAAVAQHGLAYFVMEHEPPWMMTSITHTLKPEEKIAAIALLGDAMKTSNPTIVTALGTPHHQVQLRPADAVQGFTTSVGLPGGRAESGPWRAEALRDIRAVAVDAAGQLWIVEGDLHFGRFTVWETAGKQGTLRREYFGPADPSQLAVADGDPFSVSLGGLRWQIDPATYAVKALEHLAQPPAPTPVLGEFRDPGGLMLWQAPGGEAWSVHRAADGRVLGWRRGIGAELHHLAGLEKTQPLGAGRVTVGAR